MMPHILSDSFGKAFQETLENNDQRGITRTTSTMKREEQRKRSRISGWLLSRVYMENCTKVYSTFVSIIDKKKDKLPQSSTQHDYIIMLYLLHCSSTHYLPSFVNKWVSSLLVDIIKRRGVSCTSSWKKRHADDATAPSLKYCLVSIFGQLFSRCFASSFVWHNNCLVDQVTHVLDFASNYSLESNVHEGKMRLSVSKILMCVFGKKICMKRKLKGRE